MACTAVFCITGWLLYILWWWCKTVLGNEPIFEWDSYCQLVKPTLFSSCLDHLLCIVGEEIKKVNEFNFFLKLKSNFAPKRFRWNAYTDFNILEKLELYLIFFSLYVTLWKCSGRSFLDRTLIYNTFLNTTCFLFPLPAFSFTWDRNPWYPCKQFLPLR